MPKKIEVIGLMSGTSFDGIDLSYIETDGVKIFHYMGNYFHEYPNKLLNKYLNIKTFSIEELLEFERAVTLLHLEAIEQFLLVNKISKKEIDLIGFHGQTLYHNPVKKLLLQLGNPHILTAKLGIDVISDFRRRDIENGGQGAPLVPFYHEAIIDKKLYPAAVVNIGGISNITILDNNFITAHDTGPGNALLNDFIRYHDSNLICDFNGEISSKGVVDHKLIEEMMSNEFFSTKPPKSLDRNFLSFERFLSLGIENGAATICFLIAKAITLSINDSTKNIFICGGGRKNKTIMKYLIKLSNALVAQIDILQDSKGNNLDGDFIESQAFAYLAARIKYNLPISNYSTTGTKGQSPGGAFYQA